MKVTSYHEGQAGDFAFTADNAARAKTLMTRYPEGRQASAVIALLDLAQRQNGGWLSREAIEYVANFLEMAPIRVHEVASFYSMLNTKPVGKHLVQVCRTTPCWLRGAAALTRTCRDKLGVGLGETSADGQFTLVEVECLGACANAPVVQIGDDFYEDLTPGRLAEILDDLEAGKEVPAGSQTGRLSSMAEAGMTTLEDLPPRAPADPTGALGGGAAAGPEEGV
jgi:NADH-quinone oxidoreductase subunit E